MRGTLVRYRVPARKNLGPDTFRQENILVPPGHVWTKSHLPLSLIIMNYNKIIFI